MQIQSYTSNVNFGQVYVNSTEAQKLLRKADRIIKANYKTDYININIPDGHKKPLWSVFSKHIQERQAKNPNNILIDIADKAKQLLSIKTIDSRGNTITRHTVSPIPKFGTHNEIMPKNDYYQSYYHSFDQKRYGQSDFLDALDKAEYEVDMLYQKQLKEISKSQISLRELPRTVNKQRNAELVRNPRRLEKAKSKLQLHVQRPFENLKSMLPHEPQITKLEPKNKEKLPRRLKKEARRNESI